ncbi:hypothetical protein FRC04_006607 [Tulasnella sp. 424]|nr:hypothetical protein FRC04_006607 [Tulasnella sp. 424]
MAVFQPKADQLSGREVVAEVVEVLETVEEADDVEDNELELELDDDDEGETTQSTPAKLVEDKLEVPVSETELLDPGVCTNNVIVHVPSHTLVESPAHALSHDGTARSRSRRVNRVPAVALASVLYSCIGEPFGRSGEGSPRRALVDVAASEVHEDGEELVLVLVMEEVEVEAEVEVEEEEDVVKVVVVVVELELELEVVELVELVDC